MFVHEFTRVPTLQLVSQHLCIHFKTENTLKSSKVFMNTVEVFTDTS